MQYNGTSQSSSNFCYKIKIIHTCVYHPTTSSISPLSIPFLHSVMSTSVTVIPNKLEPADHLSHCPESQKLCHNNASRDYFGRVQVASQLRYSVGSL